MRFLVLALLVALPCSAIAEQTDFNGQDLPQGWAVKGQVGVDATQNRSGSALKIEPGGMATWTFGSEGQAGSVDLWVYEDMTTPKNPKTRRVGPRWGLIGPGGKALVVGALCAPYLNGKDTYTLSSYEGTTWFNVQYLGECRRKAGWHRWTFTMDPAKGASIAMDGKDVNAQRKRFDWNKTKFTGMVGVAIYGDSGPKPGQTIWVDDVTMIVGGAMTAKPTPPPPPPPVVPVSDPAEANPVSLVEAVRGKHPRLLFGAEDVATLKAFTTHEKGKALFDRLLKYVPVCKAPTHRNFLKDATDGQRQGFWRMPTVGLHYVLTGERASLDNATGFLKMLLELEHWETGKELDCGMSAANIMVGAALCYDWLYHDLDPAFREDVRKKLLFHARAMYHGGHLNKVKSIGYWQADPANNHRWHRNVGMTLCALAVCEGRPDEQWILRKVSDELAFVAKWLPEDGTSHESPSYLAFGASHLTLAMQASDRCFGTKYLDQPFFRNVPSFRLHAVLPGLKDAFCFGDGGGFGGYNNFTFKCAAQHRLADAQDGLWRLYENVPKAFEFTWFSLVWMDPTLTGGSLEKMPLNGYYADLGLLFARDTWAAGGVAAMFKCSVYGGLKLNEYRNENNFHYINVAHDDPDVNSFTLFAGGAMLAETSRYSKKKLTSSHNTILVNGKGQIGEGQGWTQPIKRGDKDMTRLARVTAHKEVGDVTVVDGEGGGAYPGLSRYRRTFIWVKGAYVLILDDIRAPKDVELSWLVQSPTLDERGKGQFTLRKGDAACPFQVASDVKLAPSIVVSTADNRGKPLGWKQLRLIAEGNAFRIASVYDLWGRGVKLSLEGETVQVTGKDVADTWTWKPPADGAAPTELTGARGEKPFFTLAEK